MIEVSEIAAGTRLRLVGGLIAEVLENLHDGEWLRVRIIEVPAGKEAVGSEELCHATDIIGPI